MQHAVTIDLSEVREAVEVFDRWEGRGDELPLYVRAQLARFAGSEVAAVFSVAVGEGRLEVVASPELRALIGTLRAREAA